MLKALVVYESIFGNTRDVAHAIAAGLRTHPNLEVGEPVSMGIGVREWLSQLAPSAEEHMAAAFDTAIKTRWFPVGSAARGEAKALAKAGYTVIAAPEHFYVEDSQGPMVEGELLRAQVWGAKLGENLGMSAAS